jgi:hypothetical protein
MQGMSAPHDPQPSDWHHAVIIKTNALFNTQAQAWNGTPIHYPLLELGNNDFQLFTVSELVECISIGVLMMVYYTHVYLVTVFYFGNRICSCRQMKHKGHSFLAVSNRNSYS